MYMAKVVLRREQAEVDVMKLSGYVLGADSEDEMPLWVYVCYAYCLAGQSVRKSACTLLCSTSRWKRKLIAGRTTRSSRMSQ